MRRQQPWPMTLDDVRKQYTFWLRDSTVELSEPGSAGISSLVL